MVTLDCFVALLLAMTRSLKENSNEPRADLRSLLRDRMVSAAARIQTRAEKSGAALSGTRRQCPPPRPPQLSRGGHQGEPHLLRKLSGLPADRTDRTQRRHGSRDVDDDVE